MSAVALLMEAARLGCVALLDGDADRLRFQGTTDALGPELRERIVASKPELVAILRARRAETGAAWAAAYLRLRGAWPGRVGVHPRMLAAVDAAEAAAERATAAYRAGTDTAEVFTAALGVWERLVRSAQRACSACGNAASPVSVVMDNGRRLCPRCLRGTNDGPGTGKPEGGGGGS